LPPPRHGGCKYETSQINSRRRIPYSIGNEKLEKIPLGKIKGKLTEEEERKVATDMREVYDRLIPSEAVEEKRTKLVAKLEKIFNEEWPGHDIRAHLFGSSGNLLCSDDSDGTARLFPISVYPQHATTLLTLCTT
jgi:DNA polymerase sigma